MDDARPDRLVVVGQGYAGLPVAMRAVEVGFDFLRDNMKERAAILFRRRRECYLARLWDTRDRGNRP